MSAKLLVEMYPVPHSQCSANSFSFKRARKTKQEIKPYFSSYAFGKEATAAHFPHHFVQRVKKQTSAQMLLSTNLPNVTILVHRRFLITSLPLSPI